MSLRRPAAALGIVAFVLLAAREARALDKQGSAHGGDVTVDASGFGASGSVMLGMSIINRSYAARPDNTGLALMRYAAHADLDLIGQHLSIPLDLNMFSDKELGGLAVFKPSELDLIGGLTSTWDAGPGALELGSRVESDRPLDRGGAKQFYVDARARYLFSLAAGLPGVRRALRDGDVTGWATLGWFAYNRTYFARPNNTGLAFLRYAAHVELSTFSDLVSVGIDATFFTDGQSSTKLRPTELDLTPELIFHEKAYEVHLALESDRPLDAAGMGFKQQFLYALVVWSFDLVSDQPPPPLEERAGHIPSP